VSGSGVRGAPQREARPTFVQLCGCGALQHGLRRPPQRRATALLRPAAPTPRPLFLPSAPPQPSLDRTTDDLKARESEAQSLRDALERLRDDYAELQGQYAAAQRDGSGREKQREMEVRKGGRGLRVYCGWQCWVACPR
jgi:hypothetical protein